ncbi:MAG: hypothetical protein RLZZ175_2923 [Bacteroidota bacterium]|jgi:sugar lactone lactonase YvrE
MTPKVKHKMKPLFDCTKKISNNEKILRIKSFLLFTFILIFQQSFAQWTNNQNASYYIGSTGWSAVGSLNATGVAVDATNNKLYISDYCNHVVRRYSLPITSSAPTAERTFGTGTAGTTQSTLNYPSGIAVDPTGRLYVVDGGNNRVLYWNTAHSVASDGTTANGVLGQADYTSGSANRGGTTAANTFNFSISTSGIYSCNGTSRGGYIAVYPTLSSGSYPIFISDPGNNRVLRYDSPTAGSPTASAVIGQTSATASSSGTTQSTLNTPIGLALTGSNLFIADMNNNRVLKYTSALTLSTGTNNASTVFGQSTFTSGSSSGATSTSFDLPIALAIDGKNRLYISDSNNGRVVTINNATTASTNTAYSNVLGKPDFTTNYVASISQNNLYAGITGLAINVSTKSVFVANAGLARAVQYTGSVALPATFLNVNCKSVDNINNFKFSVANESNVEKYIIETSNNGIHFQEIGSINATSNISFPKQYSAEFPINNDTYFRIKAVDFDETITLSSVNKIEENLENNWKFYPNPSASIFHFDKISFNESNSILVKITDFNGKELLNKTYNKSSFDLNLDELNDGNYIVTIIENDNISHHKITVEK